WCKPYLQQRSLHKPGCHHNYFSKRGIVLYKLITLGKYVTLLTKVLLLTS
ncbi:hypothetical protein Gohar_008412, partial [Gossypium harknessii]|nr:hypothetical protein [Gossypium harknessii]